MYFDNDYTYPVYATARLTLEVLVQNYMMENMHAEMRIKQILTSKMWLAGSSLYIPIAKTITKC